MSLKHRNAIALAMLLLAAVCWVGNLQIRWFLNKSGQTFETTMAGAYTEITTFPATVDGDTETTGMETTIPDTTYDYSIQTETRGSRAVSLCLGVAGVLLSGAAIFVFRQKKPLFGPDILGILGASLFWICDNRKIAVFYPFWRSAEGIVMMLADVLIVFAVLLTMRELWGWLCAKLPLRWCAVSRITARCTKPQLQLITLAGAIFLTASGTVLGIMAMTSLPVRYGIPLLFMLISAVLSGLCLWQYGMDLNHFQKQLDNYRSGSPICVQEGTFAETEKKLLDVQTQHEQAIQTAVTSERFKVELISNVSHDLRTPLTSILGYGELLQRETLSPEGQEQLSRLNQKAGYMRELVDALFELTKVSSGVLASQKGEIDLIRLLEQTIGLFDDQLVSSGLKVCRHYASDAAAVVTDGARMHQVFANLLTNAIKYALPGTRIHLEVLENPDSYRVRMVNTASYEMDFQPEEIVQRFARGDKARSTMGSGLGLAIAQTYTESVGGKFRVTVDGDQFSAIVELPKTERNL